jgi:predicted membrane protein
MDRAKGYSLAFGLFSVIIVLFIYMYAKAQPGIGWTFLKWACIVYLFITLGGFLVFLAILLFVAIVLFGLFIIAKIKLRGKKQKPEKRDKKAIDTEYEIKD